MLQKSWRFASEVDMQDKGPVRRNLLNILGTNGIQRQNLHPYSFIKFFFFCWIEGKMFCYSNTFHLDGVEEDGFNRLNVS